MAAWLYAAVNHLGAAADRRNAVLHARPATIEGTQRLYRWKPADWRRSAETHPITPESPTEDIEAISLSVRADQLRPP